MADKKATLLIELKDNVTAGLNRIKDATKGLADVYLGLKLGVDAFNQTFGRVVDFAKEAIKAFAESEVAVSRLTTALNNQGFTSAAYKESLIRLSAELQNVTAFSDESILETMTLLTTFGIAGKEMDKTTKAAMNLAAGMGIDLHTATMLLGKAWNGNTDTLARYGIKISETTKEADKFGEVLRQINGRFGGSAEAQLNTYAGRLQHLKNNFNDLQEKIGKELIPVAEYWMGLVDKAVTAANKWAEGDDNLTKSKDKVLVSMRLHIEQLKLEIEGTTASSARKEELIAQLDKEAAAYANLTRAKLASGEIGGAAAEPLPASKKPEDEEAAKAAKKNQDEIDEHGFMLAEKARQEIESATLTHQQQADLKAQYLAQDLDADGQHDTAKAVLSARALQRDKEINKARFQSTSEMLSMIASLSNAKNKEIAIVGKAAAIAQTMINAHVAAGKAMAAFAAIPPLAIAMGALMEAAGMAQAAQIAGIPLAHGGMVLPTMGGTMAQIGEAGKAEAVVPLDDPATKEKLADVMGGGMQIHISAGVLVADDYSVREFARRIDEELYRLGRARQTVSI